MGVVDGEFAARLHALGVGPEQVRVLWDYLVGIGYPGWDKLRWDVFMFDTTLNIYVLRGTQGSAPVRVVLHRHELVSFFLDMSRSYE